MFLKNRLPRYVAVLFPTVLLSLQTLLHAVDSFKAFHKAAQQAGPGTTLELADGTYKVDGPIKIKGLRGTAESPIVLRPNIEARRRSVVPPVLSSETASTWSLRVSYLPTTPTSRPCCSRTATTSA